MFGDHKYATVTSHLHQLASGKTGLYTPFQIEATKDLSPTSSGVVQ